MHKTLMIAAAFALPLQAVAAQSDNTNQTGPELANKDWYRIVRTRFVPGKTNEALRFIEVFLRTDDDIGIERPRIYRATSGEYDLIVVHPMREGIAGMGWANSPHQARWDAALEKRLGGSDKVAEHWASYLSLVASQSVDIVYVDKDLAPPM